MDKIKQKDILQLSLYYKKESRNISLSKLTVTNLVKKGEKNIYDFMGIIFSTIFVLIFYQVFPPNNIYT